MPTGKNFGAQYLNPNTPVIIGVSQLQQRTTDPQFSDEPVDMMINAVRAAAADAGGGIRDAARRLGAARGRHGDRAAGGVHP